MDFLNLELSDKIPDAKTIWFFKDQLCKKELTEKLFDLFTETLNSKGIIAKEGSMVDATLGTEIDVKTLEKTQKLKIESGTQPNSILKIKSQGLPSQNSNRRGDLFVHVVIEIPKKLSKQQKSMLDEFQNLD